MQSILRSVWPCVVVAAVLVMVSSPALAQEAKIGVFDAQRVSEETQMGKRAQRTLDAMQQQKMTDIEAKEAEIGELQQRLSQQSLSLSAERRSALEIDIQRRLLSLNTSKDLATRELQLELRAAEAEFNEKLRIVLDQFGREETFALILEAGAVAWAGAAVDITTALIDRFDKQFPATGGE